MITDCSGALRYSPNSKVVQSSIGGSVVELKWELVLTSLSIESVEGKAVRNWLVTVGTTVGKTVVLDAGWALSQSAGECADDIGTEAVTIGMQRRGVGIKDSAADLTMNLFW